jgi:cytochrome P450
MHRNIDIFGADADIFRPERWLEAQGEQLQMMERNNELIFGYGRFQCLGKNVAFMELNKVFVEVNQLWLSAQRLRGRTHF